MIVAMLLMAAFATAPAYAQQTPADTTTTTPSGGTDPTATPPPPPPVNPPSAGTDTTTPANPPADQTPPATTGGTPGGSGTPAASGSGSPTPGGDTTGSSGDTTPKQVSRPPADQFTTSTSGSSSAATTPSSGATPGKGATPKAGYSDSWLGQDTFTISKGAPKTHERVTTTRRNFAGLFLLGATTRSTRAEATARRTHETAKVSEPGSGAPAPGSPLPDQNPFFNLLSGPSGIAAGLMLASMLAVLGAALVLPRDRLRAFRTPTVSWSPLAYVPPIELPG